MPTYSKVLQSLLVDRSIAKDLKDKVAQRCLLHFCLLTKMEKGAFYNHETCKERSYPIQSSNPKL